MTKFRIAVVLLTILAPISAPLSHAQTASVPVQLAGTWAAATTHERAIYTAEAAFASTVAALPELLQGYARGRIREGLDPPGRVIVDLTGGVHVSFVGARTTVIEGPLGATASATGVADGTRVSTHLSGGWLDIVYEGEGSVMHQLLSTEPDGARMHLDYTVTGDRIPQPVRYRLDYVHPAP